VTRGAIAHDCPQPPSRASLAGKWRSCVYDRVVITRGALIAWLGLSGCGSLLGISDLSGPGDGGSDTNEPLLPECTAQRYVQIVGGNGGLAWFTLIWPPPRIIEQYDPTMSAFDDPSRAMKVIPDSLHPLYARTIRGEAVFKGHGTAPHPSVLVAGRNDSHTNMPSELMISSTNIGVAAEAAALQMALRPTTAAIVISTVGPFGSAPTAPATTAVADVAGMQSVLPATTSITQDQIARYFPSAAATSAGSVALGQALAIAANAFRDNALGTLIVPAYLDDPHGAWGNGNDVAATRADELVAILDAFATDLANTMEPTCGHFNKPISLADNTVIAIIGDTYKNPFLRTNWQDGTPANSNLLFLRSNGFITPGWFGRLDDSTTITNFDPRDGGDGAFAGTGVDPAATSAANAAAFYAISRGSMAITQQITSAEFTGLRAK